MTRCPVCRVEIKPPSFLCRRHWFRVPFALRERIWRLYRTQPGSQDHRAAVLEAIRGLVR